MIRNISTRTRLAALLSAALLLTAAVPPVLAEGADAPLIELITPPPATEPTATPTAEPTATPTAEPTATPTAEPTATPTAEPTATPTAEPTATPTAEPTATPTAEPVIEEIAPPPAQKTMMMLSAGAGEKKTVAAPGASFTISGDSVSITITGEAGLRMCVDATVGWDDEVYAGDVVTFSGLEAGKSYGLEVDYYDQQDGVSAFKTSFEVPAADTKTTPPAQAETTTPPPADTQTTPPAQEETTPPAIEVVTPPPVSQFALTVSEKDGVITAEIADASEREVEIFLNLGGEKVAMLSLIGNGSVTFGKQGDGVYTVRAAYVTPAEGITAVEKTIEIKNTGAAGTVPAQKTPTVLQLGAAVTTGKDYIDVKVTDADAWPLYVAVGNDVKGVSLGETVRFAGLSAGEYEIEVDYAEPVSGISPFRTSVTIAKAMAGITISGVTAGENVLTVTGTAQPGADVALTTTPSASAAAIVRADANGAFSAKITLQAGVYTQVRATYVSDNSIAAVQDGAFTVTAPASKPPLEVDTIRSDAIKVIAKTNPGVTVNLRVKAYNYGQTVVADSNGVLKYSLPQAYPKGTEVTFTVYYGTNNAQSYTHVVTVSKAKTYDTLQYGDTGDAVEEMTERLRDLGYMEDDVRRYSSAVREAVKVFQELNGLDPDGVAGHETLAALYSVGAIPYNAMSSLYPTLSRGDKGIAAVYKLQRRLKDLGYYTIAVDGIYGSGTERAVRHFQRINGLPKTGVADNATQQLLYSASAKPADSAGAQEYKVLSRSSKYHSAVVPLQRRLKELGYAVGSADGIFGSRTYRAVREFQRRNGLKATGIADEAMQRVLFSSSAVRASGSSSSSSSSSGGYAYRLLTWGSQGDDVKHLQKTLLARGYSQVRVADGIYGEWTYDAVRVFQKDHGLSVDGIAGKKTQNALYGTNY